MTLDGTGLFNERPMIVRYLADDVVASIRSGCAELLDPQLIENFGGLPRDRVAERVIRRLDLHYRKLFKVGDYDLLRF